MGHALAETAKQLGCSERTLRRYATEGAVRGRRLGPHRLELQPGEAEYLRTHWTLLHQLKRALRTERQVRTAVLFGSAATGHDRSDSDVDILVDCRQTGGGSPLALQARLSNALGRQAHVVTFERIEDSPSLLASALREGRPLLDRDGAWDALRAREGEIARAAEAEADARLARAYEVLDAARARVA